MRLTKYYKQLCSEEAKNILCKLNSEELKQFLTNCGLNQMERYELSKKVRLLRKNRIITHVPHSSLKVTDEFINRLLLTKEEFDKTNIIESDYLIDEFIPIELDGIVFPYSRLMCDVERYKDDDLEEMSSCGRGIVYKFTGDFKRLINIDDEYKAYVIKSIYDDHHSKLLDLVNRKIKEYGDCLIIDLHSFSSRYTVLNKTLINCPDICIGTNNFDKDYDLINRIQKLCNKYGYTSSINYPYSGALVPLKHLHNEKVKSIMIEVNKDIYLNDLHNVLDSKKANKLHEFFEDLYSSIA